LGNLNATLAAQLDLTRADESDGSDWSD